MASEDAPREERRRTTTRQWNGPERRSRFASSAGGQLLERSVKASPTRSAPWGTTRRVLH